MTPLFHDFFNELDIYDTGIFILMNIFVYASSDGKIFYKNKNITLYGGLTTA